MERARVPVMVVPQRMRLRLRVRVVLVALELFVGIGAVYGGVRMLRDADGFGLEQSWLDGTPFSSYTIPGLVLLVAIGGGMITAASSAIADSDWAALAALAMGVTLLGYLMVETALIGYQDATQLRLLAITLIPALALIAVGTKALRR